MERGWYFRGVVIVGSVLLAGYVLYPSYYYYFRATEEQRQSNTAFCDTLPAWSSCRKFNLGLDLQGGVHLVMGVGVDKAVEQEADRLADVLRTGLKEKGLAFARVDRPKRTADIVLELAEGTDVDAFTAHLRRELPVLEVTHREGAVFTLRLVDDEVQYRKEFAVEQALKKIRNRADKFGVTEPTIARRGEENILIQLPGVKDPERAIANIGRMAQLEFKIVDTAGTAVFDQVAEADIPAGVTRRQRTAEDGSREVYFELPFGRGAELLAKLEALVPDNREILFGDLDPTSAEQDPQKRMVRTYLLHAEAGITGDYLSRAQPQQNPDLPSQYNVSMTFDAKGAQIFEQLTEQNVKKAMAIVLDGKVMSAPVIQEKIPGGTARITLGRSANPRQQFEEARDLAKVLSAGALPAPVEIREKRQVGQSLGAESVRSGALAIGIGSLLVVAFMVLWYRGSGFIANAALMLNVVFVLACLAMFEATLTLPGMAGILLVVGMAVDANVIIFERIKEELHIGKTPRAAIEAGYGRAFATIFDSNVTTLIAGVVLYQYGSGPVRGFAVTLIIGILCSMFTAIVVTRWIYDFFTSRRRLQSLSI